MSKTNNHGERNKNVKLTEAQVRQMRRNFKFDERKDEQYLRLAKEYGVHPRTIARLILNESWRHL